MSHVIFGVRAYPMSQACAIVLLVVLTVHLSGAAGLPARRILAVLAVLVSAAVAGAVLSAPSFPPTAGLRYPGVALAVVLALPLVRWLLTGTMSLLAFGDLIAAPFALGMGIARVGCFFHGCCYGSPSQVPWAVAFPQRSLPWLQHLQEGLISPTAVHSLPVHPLQLYFAAWSMCVGVLLLRVRSRKAYDGELLLLLLALHPAGGFVLEMLKASPYPPAMFAKLVVSLCATVVLVAQVARRRGASRQVVLRQASVADRARTEDNL